MNLATARKALLLVLAIAALMVLGYATRDLWFPPPDPGSDDHDVVSEPPQQVRLTPQAQANLNLVVKPLVAETYWRTVPIPGLIVDRPAHSDRGVVAPVTAVVTKVDHFPGDTVRPGEKLFTLRVLSESLHLSQTELFKSAQEVKITEEKYERIAAQIKIGTLPKSEGIDLESQLRRLKIAIQAYRQELLSRGLMPEQIDGITQGKFVSEIEIRAPQLATAGSSQDDTYEVQELKVDLGQQVQAGQTLCLLSNHQSLFIEGRAFRPETPLIERAARDGWPVSVEFMEDAASGWPPIEQTFTIRNIANTIDPASRTFAFTIALQNQSRRYEKDGRTLILWRFRPGQKVRLHVRVEKFDNVFVLPTDAVVREGPDAYVFRQNGQFFVRVPVHVVTQDRQNAVIANDGSIPAGLYVAQNAAAQINRVLKSSSGSGLPPGFHMHADGSIHSNSAHK